MRWAHPSSGKTTRPALPISAERDRLEHQRWRIEQLLVDGAVSTDLEQYLRERLSEIDRKLVEASGGPGHDAFYYDIPYDPPEPSNDRPLRSFL